MKKYSFPTRQEMTHISNFVLKRKKKNLSQLRKDSLIWTRTAWENKMDYEVSWLGLPIIQNPYDIVLMQELVFGLQPDVIIETGIAHGGSLIFYSSLLELLGKGKVISVDVDIRKHNRKLIEKHPLVKRVTMLEGSSTDARIIAQIKKLIKKKDKVLVVLDSDHRRDHVYNELQAYKNIVSKNSYIVVFDTFMPYLLGLEGEQSYFKDNNAMQAVKRFIKENKSKFVVDKNYNKFFVSSCPDGILKRIK